MNYRAVFVASMQTVGLYAAAFVIPVAGQILALFAPAPLIVVYVRAGRREGSAALLASVLLSGLLGGWQAAAVFFFSFGLMALGAAEGMRRNMKPERVVLLGGLLPMAVITLLLSSYFIRAGKNPIAAIEAYLRGSIDEAAKFYTGLGMTEMATYVSAVSDTFIHYLVLLIPGITMATSVTQAACCYGLARAVIARRPDSAPVFNRQPFASWHAPDAWVWGLIASLALVVVPQETARLAGWNLAIIFAVVYLAQGAAIVEHYLLKAHIKSLVRGLIMALVMAMPSIVFVIALGVVDVWADIRKVRAPFKLA
ncbi:MAG TPA: DUF2232 domain-containing protein [Nitrospirota bacterium]|nr:DUF2232 domain-containing protein [Nitrospirota bacterium]